MLIENQYSPTFIIAAYPKTPKSAGVMALWNLADEIEKIGYNVVRINFFAVDSEKYILSLDGVNYKQIDENSIRNLVQEIKFPIFIAGENTDCKYFKGLNFCRYHLNKMGNLVNKGSLSEGEYHVAFNKIFYRNYDFLLEQYLGKIPLEDAEKIEYENRLINLTYFGKAHLYLKNLTPVSNTLQITREYPVSNEEYLYLLKNSKYLYCYDSASSVVLDAILMGTIPILMSNKPFEINEWEEMIEGIPVYNINGKKNFESFVDDFWSSRRRFIEQNKKIRDSFFISTVELCYNLTEFFKNNRKS